MSAEGPGLPAADAPALAAATRDLCGRRLVLLGDGPTHGDGHTDAFKAALVRRLVTRCGFGALIWESSFYEFAHLSRRAAATTEDGVAAAVGGLWRFDREVQPLIAWIVPRARTGTLRLGGLDGQLGAFGAAWANDAMINELASPLRPARREECRAALERRIRWDYPSGTQPGTGDVHAQLLGCLADMAATAATTPGPGARGERRAILGNMGAALSSDALGADAAGAARERQMFANLRWLLARWPRGTRVMIWCATVHAARPPVPRRPAPPRVAGSAPTLGALIARRYGQRSFVLGFSAADGAVRAGAGRALAIPPPTPGAVEAALPEGASAIYLGPRALARTGTAPGGFLRHAPVITRWRDALDGAVVFRREWPAHSTRPGYAVPATPPG